jgi:glycosyltransferase involved in cell wall biosynthesis
MSIDISIIIPLYNKEDFIERTLRSVVLQDISNWECIIIDDGSTDSSLERVNEFISKNSGNWKVVSQVNSGQTAARNHGVSLASGKYFAFLDADDLWPKSKLRSQFEILESDSDIALVLSAFAIFKDHVSNPRVVRHKDSHKMNKRWLQMSGFGGGLESVGMMRRTPLLEQEVFDRTLSTSSGLDLSLHLEKIGKIVLLPQIGLYYRINSGQWHADTGELSKNLEILCNRYRGSFGDNLAVNHAAYLYWISARSLGKRYLLWEMLKAVLNLKNRRLWMLGNLVWRNIVATRLGRSKMSQTLPELLLLDGD